MKDKLNLEEKLLDLVRHPNYQPLKPKAIAKKLKLADELREVKRTIKRLIKQGKLSFGPKHLVMKPDAKAGRPSKSDAKSEPAADKTKEVVGQFRRAAAGFGFVRPSDSTASDRSDDIFVPQFKTLDAADRDLVRVRVDKPRRGAPGASGRILEVVERYTYQFVGTYNETNGLGVVVVDGGIFDTGILVGDAAAKNGRPGDKVVIEMAHFPSESQPGEGVIVEVLGGRGQPGVDTLSVIKQYGLPESFPEPVLESARRQADAFDEQDISGRTDFTGKTVITIDPKTARDFDDAISLEQLSNGHWELGVHIADVSHFVPLRSPLDDEAYARATSIYLPDRVIPMLPEVISNNLASLQPDRMRYCMTALIEFTAEGIPVNTELHRGAIKSAHRFNYEEIDDYLADDEPWRKKLPAEVFGLVRNMHTLAMTLRRRRMKGGAINLVLPEVKIDLDNNGRVSGAHTVDNTESHQVIEEFMLAANEAVARHLDDQGLYYLRRIHPTPDERKLEQLTKFVQALGIECDSLRDRHEVKRVVEASEHLPEVHAIHFAVLRAMQKAVYSPEEVGHYALNSQHYCHFTSPIRRYPDLIIHRMVGDLIDGKKPDAQFDRLAMLGKHCSDLEKRATDAERDLIKLKLLNFLSDRIGQKMDAVITGVESFGVFVQGIEIPAEGLVPLDGLPDDSYNYDRDTRTLSGHRGRNQFRLGDRVQVEIVMVDPDQRMLEFGLVGRLSSTAGSTRNSRSPGKTRAGGSKSAGQGKSAGKGKPSNPGKSSGKNKRHSNPGKSSGKGRSSGTAKSSGGQRSRGNSAEQGSRSEGRSKPPTESSSGSGSSGSRSGKSSRPAGKSKSRSTGKSTSESGGSKSNSRPTGKRKSSASGSPSSGGKTRSPSKSKPKSKRNPDSQRNGSPSESTRSSSGNSGSKSTRKSASGGKSGSRRRDKRN